MELLLSTLRNILLPGNIWTDFLTLSIHFVACCFGPLPSALPPLTIATGLIGSIDKIRLHSRKIQCIPPPCMFWIRGQCPRWMRRRCAIHFIFQFLCIRLWLMIMQKNRGCARISTRHRLTSASDVQWSASLCLRAAKSRGADVHRNA